MLIIQNQPNNLINHTIKEVDEVNNVVVEVICLVDEAFWEVVQANYLIDQANCLVDEAFCFVLIMKILFYEDVINIKL